MVALKDLVRSALPEQEPEHHAVRNTISVGGLVVLAVIGLGFYWIYPELRRYLKIERM